MDEKNLKPKPPISGSGLVYIITEAFPPTSAGSSVLNRNLFTYFNADSFVIYTHKTNPTNKLDKIKNVRIRHIAWSFQYVSARLHRFLLPLQLKWAFNAIVKDSKKEKPVAIIATYPALDYLKLGLDVAVHLKIPFFPYLHDTVAEALSNTKDSSKAIAIQGEVWKKSARIFVMSEGMQELYHHKYNLLTEPVVHTYLEKIRAEEELVIKEYINPHCFWGGFVYNINNRALSRLVEVLETFHATVEIASAMTKEALMAIGINNKIIEVSFYSSRPGYLQAIENADILLLALNWPDESNIHSDELSTIFPTKTAEYLASGKLILVYAPENYFLTKFFKKYNCGIILNQSEPPALLKKLTGELEDKEQILKYRKNALRAAKIFNQVDVAENFKKMIDKTISKN